MTLPDFKPFSTAVHDQFNKMQSENSRLFRVDISGDDLWSKYLSLFEPDENPIHRERTSYDCNCCRSFLKNIEMLFLFLKKEKLTLYGTSK